MTNDRMHEVVRYCF